MRPVFLLPFAFALSLCAQTELRMESPAGAKFNFTGVVGERVRRNTDEWLLKAPTANPGMLEMFRARDRKPEPKLVPWAGEFVGKYLLSAIQALRLTSDAKLRAEVERVVKEFIATQAEDGYLGPFTKERRLRGEWDLWGHYHAIEALLLWHEETSDQAAFTAAKRAGDLICKTYLGGDARVFDAGSHEMNMSIITALGHLYRLTADQRYFQMMREVEKDWQRAGDYLRHALAGKEFYAGPAPRWESLHCLQGLLEFYRITGEDKYRRAFEHHWRSIARNDIHNNGAFSSGEQATGNQYAPGAIETCCTIAWMALSIDMLRLTGDAQVADFIEHATFNGALSAQHPSGRWWTYNTPMDGVREASAHTIVFQARAGTPELNCCSVNGPRAIGMLSEWAVMLEGDVLVVNNYTPGLYRVPLKSGGNVSFEITGDYPRGGVAKITWKAPPAREIKLKLRNPGWSRWTRISARGSTVDAAKGYQELSHPWRSGDEIAVEFDFALRTVAGDREALGKVSLYRGPLLLASEEDAPPKIDLAKLMDIPVKFGAGGPLDPWLELTLGEAKLVDYASAGCNGRAYVSWFKSAMPLPPSVATRIPEDDSELGRAGSWFRWTGPNETNALLSGYRLSISEGEDEVIAVESLANNRVRLVDPVFATLRENDVYTWRVTAIGPNGKTESVAPASRFVFKPDAPFKERTGMIPKKIAIAADAVETDGTKAAKFAVEEFPAEEFTVAMRVNVASIPSGRLAQVFSAWHAPNDDPLRLVIDNGKLYARIENPALGSSTPGVAIATNEWMNIAAVKDGGRLRLHVNGELRGEAGAPASLNTNSREIALGGNPRYTGNEFLQARFEDFRFLDRALKPEEIKAHIK